MSRTIHLTNGIINFDPVSGDCCHSVTIKDGYVHAQNSEPIEDSVCVDLEDNYAIPAFIDSHVHLLLAASFYGAADLLDCISLEGFQATLRASLQRVDSGQWLVASGWTTENLGEVPTKNWIPDDIEVPTICYQTDLHCAVVNNALLNELDSQQIQRIKGLPGGNRVVDGIIMEDALFNVLLPIVPIATNSQQISSVKNAIKDLHALGITLVGSMEHLDDISSIFVPLQQEEVIRIRMMCLDEPTPENLEKCNSMHQDDFMKITGFKSFLDGSFGSKTAKMYSEWLDSGGRGVWAGHAAKNTLQEWVDVVSTAGYAPVLHAIGDEAVGLGLKVLQEVDPALNPRIEHAQCIAPSDIEEVRNTWFGVQPLHKPEDRTIAMKSLPKENLHVLHNWRRMIDHGAKLSFGSDWPVVRPEPIETMKVAIQSGLTPQEALVASTSYAAQSLCSKKAGNLQLGSFGDVVVLDKNPLTCNWNEEAPSVTMTIQSGKIVYSKEEQHA